MSEHKKLYLKKNHELLQHAPKKQHHNNISSEEEQGEVCPDCGQIHDDDFEDNMSSSSEEQPTSLLQFQTLSLCGPINEKNSHATIQQLLFLNEAGRYIMKDPETGEFDSSVVFHEPVKFYLSTQGGSSDEMFAIYDTMRLLKDNGTDILTYGIGKIMSAGVLLLAAGTKGKRYIGQHTRLMLHGVSSGQFGHIQNLKNELKDVEWTQEQHVRSLLNETSLTRKYLQGIIKKQTNKYMTAEEAVKFGIADHIF